MIDERVECCDLWCQRQQTVQEDRDMILVVNQWQTIEADLHGDLLEIDEDGGSSWKRLRSSSGLARDDDDG